MTVTVSILISDSCTLRTGVSLLHNLSFRFHGSIVEAGTLRLLRYILELRELRLYTIVSSALCFYDISFKGSEASSLGL